jgi:hypothetical protein
LIVFVIIVDVFELPIKLPDVSFALQWVFVVVVDAQLVYFE